MCFTWMPIAVLVIAVIAGYFYFNKPSDIYLSRPLNSTYDYIIVGAGSAGAVVANRLSEDKDKSVLLIEAGGSELGILEFEIPAGFIALQRSERDWEYYTEPQKYASQSMREKRSYWPRGKVLGGTSNLNNMVYVRGSRHDFDQWETEGCTGWSYKDVLPYFIKAEDFKMEEYADSGYHGKGGYQTVSESHVTELRDIYMAASEEAGYKTVDCNGKDMIGFCKMQSSIKNGQRWSTAKAYLRPVMERENLHISVNSIVTKIIIENKKAVGIEMIKDGRKKRIMVKKEVIVSAGSVNSPQLLMLSGIGPKQHLQQFKIPVHADLPVGSNLQDHMFVGVPIEANVTYGIDIDKATSIKTLLQYFIFGKGYLTSSALEATLYTHSSKGDKSFYPDIQLHFLSINFDPNMAKKYNPNNMDDESIENMINANIDASMVIMPTLIHPKSRGEIRLKSTDPFDHPAIDPHYLEQEEDVNVLIEGIRVTQKLIKTKELQKFGAKESNLVVLNPKCSHTEYDSDAFWECGIRNAGQTVYHPTSTCRMGATNDPTAVVDSQLRVKGIAGLRVVDASVMRNIPSGNTNAPSIMIGEKASDMIRGKDTVADIRAKTKNL
ncbi:glucose dehydrogenase [FAD, quinone]-like [Mytilus trossulus]|uniref:glucose dehydrogenase [FAD, quinone]-like n=1 Tax=Mytilus trossulus TaxID=6551 RepID=UPI0030074B56